MTHEEIQLEAYYLWEAAGKPEGQSTYFWRQAMQKLRAREVTVNFQRATYAYLSSLYGFDQLNWLEIEDEVKKPLICDWRKEGF